ncbi:hypothetical protein D3C80_1947120 [compost metagenome]
MIELLLLTGKAHQHIWGINFCVLVIITQREKGPSKLRMQALEICEDLLRFDFRAWVAGWYFVVCAGHAESS